MVTYICNTQIIWNIRALREVFWRDTLASLSNLNKLYLGNNELRTVDRLARLTNHVALDLALSYLTNVNAFAALTNLGILYLQDNCIADFSALEKALPACEIVKDSQSDPVACEE